MDSFIKNALENRKKQLELELSANASKQEELKEICQALDKLETCKGCAEGCDECRTGWRYR